MNVWTVRQKMAVVERWPLWTEVFFAPDTKGPGDLANVAVQALLIEINIVICIASCKSKCELI